MNKANVNPAMWLHVRITSIHWRNRAVNIPTLFLRHAPLSLFFKHVVNQTDLYCQGQIPTLG